VDPYCKLPQFYPRKRQGKPMEKQIAIFDGVKPEASLKCFIANPIKH